MGTHPIFESDFDCLTDQLMILRGRRSGSLRVILGTSAFWLVIWWSSRDYFCSQVSLGSPPRAAREQSNDDVEGNLPARKNIIESIGDGINNVQRAIQNFNPDGPGEMGTAVKIPPEL